MCIVTGDKSAHFLKLSFDQAGAQLCQFSFKTFNDNFFPTTKKMIESKTPTIKIN